MRSKCVKGDLKFNMADIFIRKEHLETETQTHRDKAGR